MEGEVRKIVVYGAWRKESREVLWRGVCWGGNGFVHSSGAG